MEMFDPLFLLMHSMFFYTNITLILIYFALIAVVVIINLVLGGDLTFARCTPRWVWPGAGGRAERSAGSWKSKRKFFCDFLSMS